MRSTALLVVTRRWAVVFMAFMVACSGDAREANSDRENEKAPPPMAGMQMDSAQSIPATVTFTENQIKHGGITGERVIMTTVSSTASVPARITVNEDRTARLGAPAGGRIVAVRVSPGDRVSRGQILVTIQSPEAGTAQADVSKAVSGVNSARAQATYAKAALARQERLLALKVTSRQEYDRAAADYQLTQSTLAEAEAELRRARSTAAQLGATNSANGEIAIRSPMAGVVLSRTATPGAVIESGAPLVIVTDPTILWLTVNAPEQFSGVFHRGQVLSFTVPAFPGEKFTARVNAVGAGLDPETRTLPVRGTIANESGRLKPEMIATAVAESQSGSPAVLVPEDAVQLLDGKPNVFVIEPNATGSTTISRRIVETGPRANGRIAITRGLSGGETIVVRGAFAVKSQFDKSNMPAMEM